MTEINASRRTSSQVGPNIGGYNHLPPLRNSIISEEDEEPEENRPIAVPLDKDDSGIPIIVNADDVVEHNRHGLVQHYIDMRRKSLRDDHVKFGKSHTSNNAALGVHKMLDPKSGFRYRHSARDASILIDENERKGLVSVMIKEKDPEDHLRRVSFLSSLTQRSSIASVDEDFGVRDNSNIEDKLGSTLAYSSDLLDKKRSPSFNLIHASLDDLLQDQILSMNNKNLYNHYLNTIKPSFVSSSRQSRDDASQYSKSQNSHRRLQLFEALMAQNLMFIDVLVKEASRIQTPLTIYAANHFKKYKADYLSAYQYSKLPIEPENQSKNINDSIEQLYTPSLNQIANNFIVDDMNARERWRFAINAINTMYKNLKTFDFEGYAKRNVENAPGVNENTLTYELKKYYYRPNIVFSIKVRYNSTMFFFKKKSKMLFCGCVSYKNC